MKKMVFLSVAILFAAGVFVVSCRKNGTHNFVEDNKTMKSLSMSTGKSIFDEIGRKHNELLAEYDYTILDRDLDDVKKYFDSILIEQGVYSEYSSNDILELIRDANGSYYEDDETMFREMRNKYALYNCDSVVFSTKIDRFLEMAYGLSENSATLEEALFFLNNYESEIDNTEMSDEERFSILTSVYLCRHSLNYWENVLTKENLKEHGIEKKKGWVQNLLRAAQCRGCVSLMDGLGGIAVGYFGPGVIPATAAISHLARYCLCNTCKEYGSKQGPCPK